MTTSSGATRVYGGVDAAQRTSERRERLLEAGLELLGGADESVGLTVRGACKASGLVARYFYESFEDGDALAVAVHERVVSDLVAASLAALAESPHATDERGRVRTGLASIVAYLAEDPRRGRLIFRTAATHPALAPRRLEVTRMFTQLLTAQAETYYQLSPSPTLDTVARFLVGGFGETLTAWQHGDLDVTQDELVEICIDLFTASSSSLPGR